MFSFVARIARFNCHCALRCSTGCALIAGLLLTLSSTATADSCGYYVKRLGPGFVPGKDAASKLAEQPHDNRSEIPCPCHGPECRRGPQDHTPLPPSAPTRVVAPQDLMSLADSDLESIFGSSWLSSNFSGQ